MYLIEKFAQWKNARKLKTFLSLREFLFLITYLFIYNPQCSIYCNTVKVRAWEKITSVTEASFSVKKSTTRRLFIHRSNHTISQLTFLTLYWPYIQPFTDRRFFSTTRYKGVKIHPCLSFKTREIHGRDTWI